jgi:tetratricopeptide (TPR) repeat protein
LGTASLDGTFKPTNATRRTFLFDDALKALDAKDLNRAENVLDRILFLNPYDVEALFERGLLAHERSDSEASVAFFKRVIELDPSIIEAQFLLGYHLRQLGDDGKVK